MRRSFILFELNEVPIRVVRHFADRHPRSAFAKMLRNGGQWDTITPDEGHLSPWISWPTLHRGVPGTKHGIIALGQDISEVDHSYPPVWDLLTRAGRRVGLFGSLHSYPLPANVEQYAFYVPDTFAAGPEAHPPELSPFQSFNLHMVDRSGRNVSSELPVKEAATFLLKSLPAGLRATTLAKIFQQLASERIWKYRSARRRTIQSILAFDLFRAQLQLKRPDAAFFFTNHVASAMHRYWPATFVQDYRAACWDNSWLKRFSGEVDYAMGEADQMLAELMEFSDHNPDYVVLVSGSMGQAAVDDPNRKVSAEVLVRDMGKFLHALGIDDGWQRRRTMEPTYTLSFNQEQSVDRFIEAIATMSIAGQPVRSRRLDAHGVEFILGHSNLSDNELNLLLGNRPVELHEIGIANVLIEDEVGAAAYHVPEGMLLVYDPRGAPGGRAARVPVLTTQIAPTLLDLQGVELAGYMEKPVDLSLAEGRRGLAEVA